MKSSLSSKNTTVILLVVLAIAILFGIYYYFVLPKLNEVDAKESTVSSLNSEIATLNEQIALVEEQKTVATSNMVALRNKVPQTREIENLLLSIEEVEAITGVRVESISFNNYDSLVSGAGLVDPNAPTTEEQATSEGTTTEGATDTVTTEGTTEETTKEATDSKTATEENGAETANTKETVTPVSTIAPESLPAELKLLTLSLSIISPEYKKLQSFIKELEQIERIVKIDTFSFTLPGEEELVSENPNLEVTSTIQITTFYYEGDQ